MNNLSWTLFCDGKAHKFLTKTSITFYSLGEETDKMSGLFSAAFIGPNEAFNNDWLIFHPGICFVCDAPTQMTSDSKEKKTFCERSGKSGSWFEAPGNVSWWIKLRNGLKLSSDSVFFVFLLQKTETDKVDWWPF